MTRKAGSRSIAALICQITNFFVGDRAWIKDPTNAGAGRKLETQLSIDDACDLFVDSSMR